MQVSLGEGYLVNALIMYAYYSQITNAHGWKLCNYRYVYLCLHELALSPGLSRSLSF